MSSLWWRKNDENRLIFPAFFLIFCLREFREGL